MDILPVFKPKPVITPAILKNSNTELMAQDINLSEEFIKKCLTTIDKKPSRLSIELVKEIDAIVATHPLSERCAKLLQILKGIPAEEDTPQFEHSIIIRHLNRALYLDHTSRTTHHKISIILLGNNNYRELKKVPLDHLLLQIKSQREKFRTTFFK